MSERRQAQGLVQDAALKLEDAVSALDGAMQYLEGHDFLAAANGPLRTSLAQGRANVQQLSAELWDAQVRT